MPDVTVILGAATVKTFLRIWLHNDDASQATDTLTDLIASKVSDTRQQRRLRRLFENIEEKIADQILTVLGSEFRNVPENEREAAIFAVSQTLDRARLTTPDIFSADLDPLFLERHIRLTAGPETRDLSADATSLYDRILSQCCAYIVEMSDALPGFQVGVFAELLSRETEILDRLSELINRISALSVRDGSERFENAYRQLLAKKLDHLDLFGVTISDAVRTYSLSAAYISLTVNSANLGRRLADRARQYPDSSLAKREGRENDTWIIEGALSATRRLFLRGDAGTGKTTLLQWIAVRTALRDFRPPLTSWNESIPFLIRLRQYSGRPLPTPEQFLSDVGRHIAEEMPIGWVQQSLRSGNAVVLIDGIDELRESERESARAWLRDLIMSFPEPRYIVTSRPAAVTEAWLEQDDFDPAEVQPMTWRDVEALVAQWHAAFCQATHDEEEKQQVLASQTQLLSNIKAHRNLRQLATNPLLTALLCALNLDRRMQLPRDRMEVYKIALEMLLERRDTERRIDTSDFSISRQDKLVLLMDIAYWLIRNGLSDAPVERVIERVNQRLGSMRQIEASGEQVLNYLLDRSGILRKPTVDRVDFIHRTFEEYLAGAAAIESDDVGVLIEHSDDDQWREVIIMAVGHALLHQRNELLDGLLQRAHEEPRASQVIEVLAVACLETCHQLDSAVLARVEAVAKKLLPPRKIADAQALAVGGDFVLDLVRVHDLQNVREVVATMRLASLIGGPKGYEVIKECAYLKYPKPRSVVKELKQEWIRFDPEVFARELLRDEVIDFMSVRDPAYLAYLRYPYVDALNLEFRNGYGNLSGLHSIRGLSYLAITDPLFSDLSSLAMIPELIDLILIETGPVRLGDLNHPKLKRLDFNYSHVQIDPAEPSPLAKLTSLESVQINSQFDASLLGSLLNGATKLKRFGLLDAQGVESMEQLLSIPELDRLEFLLLGSPRLTSLVGIERWAETMTGLYLRANNLDDIQRITRLKKLDFLRLEGTPTPTIDFITGLQNLRFLHIGSDIGSPDLSPIKELRNLSWLFIWGRDDVDLTPLTGAKNLNVTILNSSQRPIMGKDQLGSGVKVRFE